MAAFLRILPDLMHRSQRFRLLWLLVLSVLSLATELVAALTVFHLLAILTKSLVGDGLPFRRIPFVDSLDLQGSLIAVFCVYLVRNIVRLLELQTRENVIELVLRRLAFQLFDRYLRASFLRHLQFHSSDAVRLLWTELELNGRRVLLSLLSLTSEIVIIVAISVTLFWTVPTRALLVVPVMLCGIGGALLLTRRWQLNWSNQYYEVEGRLLKLVEEFFPAIAEIRTAQKEAHIQEEFRRVRTQSGQLIRRRSFMETFPGVVLEMSLITGLCFIVWATMQNEATSRLVFPTLGMFAYAGLRILPALQRLVALVSTIRSEQRFVTELHERLTSNDLAPDERSSDLVREIAVQGTIDFCSVSYRYDREDSPGISNVSLSIPVGSSLGIVGPTGSGKTTLLYNLLGLLTPQSGRTLVDGKDIHQHLSSWRSQVAYVSQQPFLFDASILQNIVLQFDVSDIDQSLFDECVRTAQLDAWLKSLPDGAATSVGQDGVRISGGQRQRIAIARALYQRPAVLVLDEPTSALDRATAQSITAALTNLAQQLTLIVVTHDLLLAESFSQVYTVPAAANAE